MQGGQGAVPQGRAEQCVAHGLDQEAGADAEQDQGQRRGLQRRHVLGDRRVQRETAEARDVEDLLHRDRAADQGDDGRQELREHPGQGAAQRVRAMRPAGYP